MNRNVLNSVPLGVGTQNTLIRVIVAQALQMAGTLRASVFQYSKITALHTQTSALKAGRWVSAKATAVKELTGVVAGAVYHPVYAVGTQVIRLVATALPHRERQVKLNTLAGLMQGISPTIWLARHQQIEACMSHASLVTPTIGRDVYQTLSNSLIEVNSISPTILRARNVSIQQEHQLTTIAIAHDLNYEAAPKGRRLSLPVAPKRRVAVTVKPA